MDTATTTTTTQTPNAGQFAPAVPLETMQRVTITAGIGRDAAGNEIDVIRETLPALERIRSHLAATFGGYTETAADGGWVDGAGKLVQELARVWTIVAPSDTDARLAAEWVRDELRQESVVLTSEPITAAFI